MTPVTRDTTVRKNINIDKERKIEKVFIHKEHNSTKECFGHNLFLTKRRRMEDMRGWLLSY